MLLCASQYQYLNNIIFTNAHKNKQLYYILGLSIFKALIYSIQNYYIIFVIYNSLQQKSTEISIKIPSMQDIFKILSKITTDNSYPYIIIIFMFLFLQFLNKKHNALIVSYYNNIYQNLNKIKYQLFFTQIIQAKDTKQNIISVRNQIFLYQSIIIRIFWCSLECIYIMFKVIGFIITYYIFKNIPMLYNSIFNQIDIMHILYISCLILVTPLLVLFIHRYTNKKYNNINVLTQSRFKNRNHLLINTKKVLQDTTLNDTYIETHILYNMNMNSLSIFNIIISIVIYHFIGKMSGVCVLMINLLFNNTIKYVMQIGYDLREIKKYQFNIIKIEKKENIMYVTYNNITSIYTANNSITNKDDIGIIYSYLENIDFTIEELILLTKSKITLTILLYQLIKSDKYFIDVSLSSYITDKRIPSIQRKAIFQTILDHIENVNIIDVSSSSDSKKLSNNNSIYYEVI